MNHLNHSISCKKCGSRHTRQIHRSFLEKHLFRIKAIVHCGKCNENSIYK